MQVALTSIETLLETLPMQLNAVNFIDAFLPLLCILLGDKDEIKQQSHQVRHMHY